MSWKTIGAPILFGPRHIYIVPDRGTGEKSATCVFDAAEHRGPYEETRLETPGLSPKRIADLRARKPRLQQLIGVVKAVAKEKLVGLIDLNTPLANRADLFTEADGVHPTRPATWPSRN
jgi:hypothetical protein